MVFFEGGWLGAKPPAQEDAGVLEDQITIAVGGNAHEKMTGEAGAGCSKHATIATGQRRGAEKASSKFDLFVHPNGPRSPY
jgi:hypothetical protein